MSSKHKPKAIGVALWIGGGLKNVSEYSEWSMWATDTSLKNLSEIIYPTDKRLLVGACINSFVYLTISPIICIKQFFVSFQSLMSSASNKSSKKRKKDISVALLTEHKKRPLQRLNCFTPLHPPSLSFGRNNVAALLVILPPWWFSLAFFTPLVWTDAAPSCSPHPLGLP